MSLPLPSPYVGAHVRLAVSGADGTAHLEGKSSLVSAGTRKVSSNILPSVFSFEKSKEIKQQPIPGIKWKIK